MVRHKETLSPGVMPKAKRNKVKHDPAKVKEALESILTKRYKLREAARAFGIPASTLAEKKSGKYPVDPVPMCRLLNAEEEQKLAKYVLEMAKRGFLLTSEELRATAKGMIDVRHPPEGDLDMNLPSNAWVYRYCKRHPGIKLRILKHLSKKACLVTSTFISKWFSDLKAFVDAVDPEILQDKSRIYNADESKFVFQAGKVAAFQGVKQFYKDTVSQKSQVTVLACMSAAGHFTNPFIVYPLKSQPSSDLTQGFPGARYNISENGWMTATIFYEWLRDVFIPATQKIKKPVLLLVDGHTSHTSLETALICEQNGIILYCIPAHTSYLIEPLDQDFFRIIKQAWSKTIKQHLFQTGNSVNLESFASLLRSVWDSCCNREVASKSFKRAGLLPYNPDRVLASKRFVSSSVDLQSANNFSETTTDQEGTGNLPTFTRLEHNIEMPDLPSDEQELPEAPKPTIASTSEETTYLPNTALSFSNGITSLANQLPSKHTAAPVYSVTVLTPTFAAASSVPLETASAAPNYSVSLLTPTSAAASSVPLPTASAAPNSSVSSLKPTAAPAFSAPLPTPTAAPVYSVSLLKPTFAAASSIPLPNPPPLMNFFQLKAFLEMMEFVLDDMSRNEFNSFFAVLAGTETQPTNEKFDKFVQHLVAFRNTNFTSLPGTSQPPKRSSLSVSGNRQMPYYPPKSKVLEANKPASAIPFHTIEHNYSGNNIRGTIAIAKPK
ncbi:hypothetical protein EGW08_001363 [Elysia chlorotica]|uniref:HTH CENPB-type domain-containing protein n=1 Tax=Elysia chlorotica TaxID=188477 RepID=A0A3S1BWZ1_ELYCH|nr:hypothetical protein EGW08_001363 [Elysia chlorotica]